jgi:outer membrane protein OmpA-like peptidoglycan-associated protein
MRHLTLLVVLCACCAVLACGGSSKRPDGGKVLYSFKGDVHFDNNSSQITPAGKAELQKMVGGQANIPEGNHIIVEGHTSNTGTPEYNMTLSKQRAETVAKVLTDMGFDKTRVSAKGYGMEKPLYPNDTEANRGKNRRVDIVLVPDAK